MAKTYTISKKRARLISFKNVGRDFSSDFIYIKKTKSGNLIVGNIVGSGPGKYEYQKKIARKRKDGSYYISMPGSPLNSYYKR